MRIQQPEMSLLLSVFSRFQFHLSPLATHAEMDKTRRARDGTCISRVHNKCGDWAYAGEAEY